MNTSIEIGMAKPTIIAALDAYDTWLGRHCAVIPAELAEKRRLMGKTVFAFLRGTCFRFAAQFAMTLPELAKATGVPSAGDAHLENFGTWRDAEGRLVWGVNDLDEATLLPWPCDLVRLATSALVARTGAGPRSREIAATLLAGYQRSLAAPRSFVLDEQNVALRAFVVPTEKSRADFWAGLARLTSTQAVPPEWQAALTAALPPGAVPSRFVHRVAGLGSLGRPRFAVIADWAGGTVVREAKARVPSAWLFAEYPGAQAIDPLQLAQAPGRAPDPWLRLYPSMVIRRLAPDSRRLDAPGGNPAALLEQLDAMGAEIGNLHATAAQARLASAELRAMPPDWLRDAAKAMADVVSADHAALRG